LFALSGPNELGRHFARPLGFDLSRGLVLTQSFERRLA
jgi:hypothetical protein